MAVTGRSRDRLIPPAPRVAVPAASVPDLRRRRILVGDPVSGWRPARAASDPHISPEGRTIVAVISEPEMWRAEISGVDVHAQAEPIERVWVEHYLQQHTNVDSVEADLAEAEIRAALADFEQQLAHLTGLDAPPARQAVPARQAGSLMSRRVTRLTDKGQRWQNDWMATSEPHLDGGGEIRVLVTREDAWWRWTITGQDPHADPVGIDDLWVY